jgi:hypothetical protein
MVHVHLLQANVVFHGKYFHEFTEAGESRGHHFVPSKVDECVLPRLLIGILYILSILLSSILMKR